MSNLSKGTYTFLLEDAKGCKVIKKINIENPEEFKIDLPRPILCKGQTYDLDGTINDEKATYEWTSDTGFSSRDAIITITESGIYNVKAISSLGCVVTESIDISYQEQVIDAEFLISSHAYLGKEVVIFNVSEPMSDSYEWIIPTGVTITEENGVSLVLKFNKAKKYKIGLISRQGSCSQVIYKTIVIEKSLDFADPGDTVDPFIKSFVVAPNPNDGKFRVLVELVEKAPISLRIFDISGILISEKKPLESLQDYKIRFNLELKGQIYFVVLESSKQTQVRKIIVIK